MLHAVDLIGELGKFLCVLGERCLPGLIEFASALADPVAEILEYAVGNEELCVLGPTIILFRKPHFLLTQRFAVGFVGILLVRRSVADMAVEDDQSRAIFGFEK